MGAAESRAGVILSTHFSRNCAFTATDAGYREISQSFCQGEKIGVGLRFTFVDTDGRPLKWAFINNAAYRIAGGIFASNPSFP